MILRATYTEWYGECSDGGAKHICCECMGGWQCVAEPNSLIRNFKNLLCPDCAKEFAKDKQKYRTWVKRKQDYYINKYTVIRVEQAIEELGLDKVLQIMKESLCRQ